MTTPASCRVHGGELAGQVVPSAVTGRVWRSDRASFQGRGRSRGNAIALKAGEKRLSSGVEYTNTLSVYKGTEKGPDDKHNCAEA